MKEASSSTHYSDHSAVLSLPSQESMTDTYSMAQNELMNDNEAVRQLSIPQQSLQASEAEKVDLNGTAGGHSESIFTKQEEQNIVEFLTTLYSLGYGFSRYDMMIVAKEYALYLKKEKGEKFLSNNKLFKVVRNLPELRVIYKRCTMSLSNILTSFFDRLEKVMVEHSFSDTPQLVFSVIDIEIRQDEATSEEDQILATIVACGNAAGQSIPPFFVFQGQEMKQDLMNNALPGSSGIVSENGLVNAEVFIQFLTEHLLRNISEEDMGKPILVHVNGVKFCSVGLLDLAKARNINLIFPPIEISNALMPLDIACIETFQEEYTTECEKHMANTKSDIAVHNMSEIVSKVYPKALSSANISKGFRKAGLFPCDRRMLIVKSTD